MTCTSFQPFYIIETFKLREIQPFILFILMRNHSQTEEPSAASVTRHATRDIRIGTCDTATHPSRDTRHTQRSVTRHATYATVSHATRDIRIGTRRRIRHATNYNASIALFKSLGLFFVASKDLSRLLLPLI